MHPSGRLVQYSSMIITVQLCYLDSNNVQLCTPAIHHENNLIEITQEI
jgi:hypothetical protein